MLLTLLFLAVDKTAAVFSSGVCIVIRPMLLVLTTAQRLSVSKNDITPLRRPYPYPPTHTLSLSLSLTHTHTHTYARTHAHTHARTHARAHCLQVLYVNKRRTQCCFLLCFNPSASSFPTCGCSVDPTAVGLIWFLSPLEIKVRLQI